MVGEFQSLNNCFSVEIVCVKISPKKKKKSILFFLKKTLSLTSSAELQISPMQ